MTSRGQVPVATSDSAGPIQGRRLLRLAWVAVAAIPFAFIAGMFAGEGLLAMQGYSGEGPIPPGAVALAAGPAILLILAPALAAAVLGFRARSHGQKRGIVPGVIGIVAAAFTIITNLLPLVLRAG